MSFKAAPACGYPRKSKYPKDSRMLHSCEPARTDAEIGAEVERLFKKTKIFIFGGKVRTKKGLMVLRVLLHAGTVILLPSSTARY